MNLARSLRLAFAEWQPAGLSVDEQRVIESTIDRFERDLKALYQKMLGYAVAWVARKQFAEEELDIQFIAADADVLVNSVKVSIETLRPGTATVTDAIEYTGGKLIKGELQNWSGMLMAHISQQVKLGASREQITESLLATFGQLTTPLLPEWRARLIAQTEVLRAFNNVAESSLLATGNTHVRWVDGQLGACPSCSKLDGTIIPIVLKGSYARFHDTIRGFVVPHPPLHPGCRCTIIGATEQEFLEQPDFLNKSAYSKAGTLHPLSTFTPLPSLPPVVKSPLQQLEDEIEEWFKDKPLPDDNSSSIEEFKAFGKFKYGDDNGFMNLGLELQKLSGGTVTWKSIIDKLKAKAPAPQPIPRAPALKVESGGAKFPVPVKSAAFIDWYDQYGKGKTGVAVFQAYAKHTGKSMATIKAEIEAEGYTIPQLTKVKLGEALPPPAVVPPKKKPQPKAPPPNTAKVDPSKPDSAFKDKTLVVDDPGESYWAQATKTGAQMGSNVGGVYTGPDGQRWYLKRYTRSENQGAAEVLAHSFHDVLGIGAPARVLIKMNGVEWYATKMMPSLTSRTAAEWKQYFKQHPEELARIHIASALTANWDVVGKTFDNLLWDDIAKKPVIIDAGGAFMFRAQGGAKTFGPSVPDFHSLMDSSVNKNAASIFSGLYNDLPSINAGLQAIAHLRSMTPYILNSAAGQRLGSGMNATILARLDDLEEKLKTLQKQKEALANYKPANAKVPHLNPDDFASIKKVLDDLGIDKAAYLKLDDQDRRSINQLSARWSGSAQSNEATIAKARTLEIVFGMDPEDAYIWEVKRQQPGLSPHMLESYKDKFRNRAALFSRTAWEAVYKENQAELRAKHPSGYVTLHRGINGKHTASADNLLRAAKELAASGITVWYPASLASFSTSARIANSFKGSGGINGVITIKVPIEQVFMGNEYLDSHGGYHHNEKEYILITGPGGLVLTGEQLKVYRSGRLISAPGNTTFAEPTYDPDGFVSAYTITPEMDEDWWAWLHRDDDSKQDEQRID